MHKIKQCYKGKILDDVVKYGEHGTNGVMRGNIERHMNSDGHLKCIEETGGAPAIRSQGILDKTFGSSKQRGIKAVVPLLRTALHIAR